MFQQFTTSLGDHQLFLKYFNHVILFRIAVNQISYFDWQHLSLIVKADILNIFPSLLGKGGIDLYPLGLGLYKPGFKVLPTIPVNQMGQLQIRILMSKRNTSRFLDGANFSSEALSLKKITYLIKFILKIQVIQLTQHNLVAISILSQCSILLVMPFYMIRDDHLDLIHIKHS